MQISSFMYSFDTKMWDAYVVRIKIKARMEAIRYGGCMGQMTDFTRHNASARTGQEAEKSRLFKHA